MCVPARPALSDDGVDLRNSDRSLCEDLLMLMRHLCLLFRSGCVVFLLALSAMFAHAQPAADNALDGLQWRLVGPFRAGWSTMVVGIPDQPDTFLFGAADGGVWKTTDAGQTWQPIFDEQPDASIGAIAIAPSNPQIIYVGTGQPEPRYDIAAGNGMYKSVDGGKTWQHIGLDATRHIGAILIDPKNPDVVVVAALGHIFGPNPERGIFRSSDGGKTWQHTLAINAETGVVDLAADPADPNTIYASAWQARNYPWLSYFTPISGNHSGIYKSSDGGLSWTLLAGKGWPEGKLGRIGLAVAHTAGGARVYASVDGGTKGGLYRSDDAGANWLYVNPTKAFASWYSSRLSVAPNDPDTIYTVGQSIRRSTDGGKTFEIIKGAPGGDDYHFVWINPKHADHLVTASDQGTVVSVNGGKSWSSWYNQPTGQFYHLGADNRFPYWIYSGQQDSGTVAIASRSDYGALSFRDWHPVGADERDYDLPDPLDPNIVYGSGLGGRLTRWDARTGITQNITPWPVSSYGKRATDVKYRYTWITPIALSAKPPYALYQGAQVLFRSIDQGRHWQTISPDLSAKSGSDKKCAEGDLSLADARRCGFGLIYTIAPSPRDNDEIWIGTDDGRIQLTRDGGKQWNEITPPHLPNWAQVSSIDPSALQAGTAYAAADDHREDSFVPHVYRTHDYGKSWAEITHGLPSNRFVSVVRADPVRVGLLYAGTENGVFVSFDDGDNWQSLQHDLPHTWVRDLLVHGNDLIAATQGRAIWLLDDVSVLRQLDPSAMQTRLFHPAPAYRLRANQNGDTPLPPETPLGRNPPDGAVIDYSLAANAHSPMVLEVRDGAGKILRHFASDKPESTPAVARYFDAQWIKPPAQLVATAGAHRFVWDLRYSRPQASQYGYSIAATWGKSAPITPQGGLVLPGDYDIVMRVDGQEYHAALKVLADPRVDVDPAALKQAIDFSVALSAALKRDYIGHGEIRAVRKQIVALKTALVSSQKNTAVSAALNAFDNKAAALINSAGEGTTNLAAIGEVLVGISNDIENTDRAPTEPQRQASEIYDGLLSKTLSQWQALKDHDLIALNAQLHAANLSEIVLPKEDQITPESDDDGQDLP